MTARGRSLKEAIDAAYEYAGKVRLENGFFRRDIGARALRAESER